MFNKILIANRGEIALRILRACRELNIKTVVVYSKADKDSLPVQLADEAICIGEAESDKSYLKIDRIISVTEICDVDAIHPGYGFLAENAHFAQICQDCHITFIGPSAKSIANMGDKSKARLTMKAIGVPVTPGSDGLVEDEKDALDITRSLGYPVILKASAGGGGRGIRIVHNDASLIQSFHACRREAERSFGNADLYIEKYIENMRHIEIQILADHHGNIVHLGERDCSIQRRRQKVIEEAPSPALDTKLRQRLGKIAVKAVKASQYTNAGTLEFILTEDKQFYFMEMNTRIQVEHPVTEAVTGIDLIKEQIRIAAGEPLGYSQDDIHIQGHAIECRINAENPYQNFTPCPGLISFCHLPGGPGVRIDSHVYSGYTIPPYYDSMIAKLIISGKDRQECISRCQRVLSEIVIDGVESTIPLQKFLLHKQAFIKGTYDTNYIEMIMKQGFTKR